MADSCRRPKYKGRHIHTIRPEDVGKDMIVVDQGVCNLGQRHVEHIALRDVIGRVRKSDVGKFVMRIKTDDGHSEYTAVESDDQMAKRKLCEAAKREPEFREV